MRHENPKTKVVGAAVCIRGGWASIEDERQGVKKEILCPRQYAHRCLRARGQERSQARCESVHRRDQAARWNAARPRVAGRSGWSNAAYVIAAQTRSLA